MLPFQPPLEPMLAQTQDVDGDRKGLGFEARSRRNHPAGCRVNELAPPHPFSLEKIVALSPSRVPQT